LDLYGRSRPQNIHIFGNRGASGIDGNIATGLGIAAASPHPTYILIGDVTALHDLNSLLATRHAPNATIIVLNNNGGNIFRRLPVSQHEPPFTEMFLTPHGLTFEHAAQMFHLDYVRAEDRETFQEALAQPSSAPRLIEVMTNGRTDHQIQQTIRQAT
jgi:2-succinyl-5-enolpyruvyl-6-hydroxy-3-cyclohexene-1-carboxylate synthase